VRDVPGLVLAAAEVDGAAAADLEPLTLSQAVETPARGGVVQDVGRKRTAMMSAMTMPAPLSTPL